MVGFSFTEVDKDGDGVLSPSDLEGFLNRNGVYASEREIHGLVHRLSDSGQVKITKEHLRSKFNLI